MATVVLPIEAGNIVFVGDFDNDGGGDGSVLENAIADATMLDRMLNVLGHSVTPVDDSLVTSAIVADADFIVVSSTSSSNTFVEIDSGDGRSGATNSLGTDATIVLMEGGNVVSQAFGLAGQVVGTVTGTSINIQTLDGYVTETFGVGASIIFDDPATITTFGVTPPNGANLGVPQFDYTGELLLASTSDNFEPVVMGINEVGDNIIVALPFGNASFDVANANGLQLFDNVFAILTLPADFDLDGNVDVDDIDALIGEIVAGTNGTEFDLSGDGNVDDVDLTAWLSEAAGQNGFGQPYLPGDSNLDGAVNATDLNNLALSWRQNLALWSAGDFTADGFVDSADLNALALNWRQSIPMASAVSAPVPEPSALFLALVGLSLVWRRPRYS
jgi:hypothetical protein